MRLRNRVLSGVVLWSVLITGLHLWMNVDWTSVLNERLPEGQRKLTVAYVPFT